jgi:hypothetical protein
MAELGFLWMMKKQKPPCAHGLSAKDTQRRALPMLPLSLLLLLLPPPFACVLLLVPLPAAPCPRQQHQQ